MKKISPDQYIYEFKSEWTKERPRLECLQENTPNTRSRIWRGEVFRFQKYLAEEVAPPGKKEELTGSSFSWSTEIEGPLLQKVQDSELDKAGEDEEEGCKRSGSLEVEEELEGGEDDGTQISQTHSEDKRRKVNNFFFKIINSYCYYIRKCELRKKKQVMCNRCQRTIILKNLSSHMKTKTCRQHCVICHMRAKGSHECSRH